MKYVSDSTVLKVLSNGLIIKACYSTMIAHCSRELNPIKFDVFLVHKDNTRIWSQTTVSRSCPDPKWEMEAIVTQLEADIANCFIDQISTSEKGLMLIWALLNRLSQLKRKAQKAKAA